MKILDNIALKSNKHDMPFISLKDIIVFPSMSTPFFAGKEATINSINKAMDTDRKIFIAYPKNDEENEQLKEGDEAFYPIGTIAHIAQVLRLPDGPLRIVVEGLERAAIKKIIYKKPFSLVRAEKLEGGNELSDEAASLMRAVQTAFTRFKGLNKKLPAQKATEIERCESPEKLVNLICSVIKPDYNKLIPLMVETTILKRLELCAITLEAENELIVLQRDINTKVKKRMEKTQRDYYLNEQIKEIKKQLHGSEDDPTGATELEQKLKEKDLPEEVLEKSIKEVQRLARLQPMSPEAGILRTYLEWITDLPWQEKSGDRLDIAKAKEILDQDHYDMEKIKERILDFIAVRKLKDKLKGPIICFVGPPGTGKTSLGRSVARALGREFVRISLGGVRDEAEIRGHRKTYIGALPGKIIQSMKKAKTVNPVFLLDEIDKMSSDFRGDPAAALLEVLDPEQNNTFVDHYMEVPYDLSNVMFITTANSLHKIPRPLLDRMEVINVPGYTIFEKIKIAQKFIIPQQLKENGLEDIDITFQEQAITDIIKNYTMESGVRNLVRKIAAVSRKIARKVVGFKYRKPLQTVHALCVHRSSVPYPDDFGRAVDENARMSETVTPYKIKRYLGNQLYSENRVNKRHRPGIASGLAWTEVGGTVLPVEVSLLEEGKGKLILTGNLGDVMKESAQIALSYARAHAKEFNIDSKIFIEKDIHIHVPEGAIPKDGPSAGITMTAALISAASGKAVRNDIAMTGEITLTDRLLPIGGVKEKVLAAHRNKLRTVVLPEGNKKDQDDLPPEVLKDMTVIFHESVEQAVETLIPELHENDDKKEKKLEEYIL